MNSYLVYDIETLKIPWDGKSEKDPTLEYALDWRDYEGLGVSVVGCYSSSRQEFMSFMASSLDDFRNHALQHDHIVGFNSQRFDDCVLAAAGYPVKTDFDLLLECWRASGLDPDYTFPEGDDENRKKYGGYKLDVLAIANFGKGKTGHGALAPALWQQGQHKKVIDYCLEDVRLTHELFLLGLRGELWHPGTRKFLELRPL